MTIYYVKIKAEVAIRMALTPTSHLSSSMDLNVIVRKGFMVALMQARESKCAPH